METPIFKYYDVFQMFQRISCASNEDIVTIKEKLLDRAKKHGEELQDELPNLKKLKQVMDDYIDGKEPTIKLVILQDFAEELGNVIKEYKKPEETGSVLNEYNQPEQKSLEQEIADKSSLYAMQYMNEQG